MRQRQNAAAALSRGGELSAQRRWQSWRGESGYLFADSAYTNGKRIPEVPRHQGSAMLSFEQGRTMVSAGVRAYGSQFDDDLNTFLLPGFATVQMMARERLGKGFSRRWRSRICSTGSIWWHSRRRRTSARPGCGG